MIEKEIKEKDSNNINENKIIRYPFYGKSKYLLDKLYIIGYDNETIHKYLNEKMKKEKIEMNDNIDTSVKMMRCSSKINQPKEIISPFDNINQYLITEKPVLINEIVNDYNKESLDIDIVIDMIFPNNPIFYYVKGSKKEFSPIKSSRNNSNYINIKTEVGNIGNNNNNNNNILNGDIEEIINKKKYFMVFSSNPQVDKYQKKSINGFCYINYCKYKENKKINEKGYDYYFPIALCFISEFPFYQSYYKLAEQIFHLFNSKKIEVPIEIMLYNLINSTLSPINGDVDLCIEPVSFYNNIINDNSNSINNSDKINKSEKKEKERKKEISPFKIIENSNNKKEENYANSSKVLIHVEKKIKFKESLKKSKIIKEEDVEKILRTKSFGNNKYIDKNLFEQIKFPFLQTYPLLQFNLPKILFDYIPITKIIFIFINTFLEKDILIFSENIEKLSLVINAFQNLNYPLNDNTYYNINACISFNNYVNGNSKYIPKALNSIIGINSSYKINYINDDKYKIKKLILYDLDNKDIIIRNKNDIELYEYIIKILKLRDDKEYKGSVLFYEIKKLSEILHMIRDNNKNNFQNEDNLYYNKKLNLEIQEAFYKFIVNILSYFYWQMNFDDLNNGIKIYFNKDYENELNNKYKKTLEEEYFFNGCKNTIKFDIFFNNYINNHECLEYYNISYIFLDEYISLISRANDLNIYNNYQLKFFNIFENLYNKKQSQKVNIDFNTFLSEYFKKYKNDFDRDIKDFNKDGRNIIRYLESKKILHYQWYELDNNLLLKYILFIKTLNNDEYERMFNINTILDDNNPKRIRIEDIEDEIEKEIISNNFYNNKLLINDDDICCMNIITLLSISLKYINFDSFTTVFIGSLFKEFFLFRKYYHILLDMIYRAINYELNISNIHKVDNLLSFYYPCINSFREKHIIPNEKITSIIININKIEHEIREKNKNIYEHEVNEKYNKIDDKNYIIFIYHNISQYGIIKEKKILKYVNDDDENDKNNWKNRLGFIVTLKNDKTILVIPKIKYIGKYKNKENENIYFESEIFSQRKIKEILDEEYKNYINTDLDITSINIKNIIDCLLNIVIYIRNSEKFNDILDISEIIKTIKTILLYYINYSAQ